jgi:DNA-binding MarR family transcriptional regulator
MDGAQFPPRPRLSLLLRLLHQQYADGIDAALSTGGFDDLRQGSVKLFPFVPLEGIQISELAVLAGVRKQTVAEAVEALERSGYMERRPNPRDARSRLVFLTERGERVRPVASLAGLRVEEQWGALIGPDNLEALRDQLHQLLELVVEKDA